MRTIETFQSLQRLHNLIQKGATGTPKSLAKRLNISERQIFRHINELKDLGFPVAYNRSTGRYYYQKSVILIIEIIIDGVNIIG